MKLVFSLLASVLVTLPAVSTAQDYGAQLFRDVPTDPADRLLWYFESSDFRPKADQAGPLAAAEWSIAPIGDGPRAGRFGLEGRLTFDPRHPGDGLVLRSSTLWTSTACKDTCPGNDRVLIAIFRFKLEFYDRGDFFVGLTDLNDFNSQVLDGASGEMIAPTYIGFHSTAADGGAFRGSIAEDGGPAFSLTSPAADELSPDEMVYMAVRVNINSNLPTNLVFAEWYYRTSGPWKLLGQQLWNGFDRTVGSDYPILVPTFAFIEREDAGANPDVWLDMVQWMRER